MGRVVFQQSPFIVAQHLQNKIFSLFVEFLYRRKEFANAPVKSWAGDESNRPRAQTQLPWPGAGKHSIVLLQSQRCALSWGPRSSEYRLSSLNIYGAIPHRTTWVWAGEAWVLCMNGTPEVYPVTAGEVLAPITCSVLCIYEFQAQWQVLTLGPPILDERWLLPCVHLPGSSPSRIQGNP